MKPVYREDVVITIDSVKTGEAVQEYREKKRVRVADVIGVMGVSLTYFYALEGGKRSWSEKLLSRAIKAIDKVSRKTRR